jgi:signal peptidase I
MPQSTLKNLWESSKTVIIAVLLAMVFRSLCYEPFHIPSGSMKGTLEIGDYIFVSKPSYGYSRYSFPFGIKFFEGRILSDARPQRGDVVVFRKPNQTSIDFIKRVVGLPGDRIQVRDGVLYINDEAVPRRRVEDYQEYDAYTRTHIRIPRYEETLPNGVTYMTLDQVPNGMVDNTPVYNVPEGYYFMMGDNRDNSTDSRYIHEVGFVPEVNLVGKAVLIAFSFDGFMSLRPGRFFKSI